MSIQPFISRLKEAINDGPATQGIIADHCDVSRQSVTNWKTTGQISVENLRKLSEVTGYRYVWLKTGKGPKKFTDSATNNEEYLALESNSVVAEARATYTANEADDELNALIRSIKYAQANRKLNKPAVSAITAFFNALVESK